MKQFSFRLFIVALLASQTLSAQTSCDLQSKIVAEGLNINTLFLKAQVAGNVFYKNEEVDEARAQVKSCSQQIGTEQQILKNKLEDKRDKANKLLKYSGVLTIQKDIDEWQKKMREAGAALENRMQEKATSGLFVVLITNIEEFNKARLQTAAQAAIAQKAVKDLVGEHIKKTQLLTDLGELKEIIRSYSSGQPEPIGAALTERSNFADRYFLYLAQVEVKPLKKSPEATPATTLPNTWVFNLDLDGNYEAQLQAKGVTREHLDQMRELVKTQLPLIRESNSTALKLLDNEMDKAEKEIGFYQEKINARKTDLANSSGEIKKVCTDLAIPFDAADPDKSALEAKNKVKRDIAELEARQIEIKDREIIPLLKVLEGTSQTELSKDLAQVIFEGSKNFENQASSSFEVEELQEVENGIGEHIFESNKVKYIRRLRKIWAFPIAGTNDDFKVVLFGQFRSGKSSVPPRVVDSTPKPPMEEKKTETVQPKVEEPKSPYKYSLEPDMVTVGGGTFQMGDDHWVKLSTFSISKFEVTNEQYIAFLNDITNKIKLDKDGKEVYYKGVTVITLEDIKYSNGAWKGGRFTAAPGEGAFPVRFVSWEGAKEYIKWLNKKTKKKYRLPTEAEWEYAARGGSKSKGYKFPGSDNPKEVAFFSTLTPFPVGLKKANELGLYDMAGNVREWCEDDYQQYLNGPVTNPKIRKTYSFGKVIRGGGYDSAINELLVVVVRQNFGQDPSRSYSYNGFRLALSTQ